MPASTHGATSCTVYENNDGTQIVVGSSILNVRAQCLVWAANLPGVGYLWGYERSVALPAGKRLCSLTDRRRLISATVVDAAATVTGSSAARARALAICARILASGWTSATDRAVNRARAVRS